MPEKTPKISPQNRRQARSLAMQALCQLDVQGDDFLNELPGFLADFADEPATIEYARELTRHTWHQKDYFDSLIAAAAKHWDIGRMPPPDRNIMRVALCEMFRPGDPPAKVAIHEAIELGKQFGTAETPAFVNGILDAIRIQNNLE